MRDYSWLESLLNRAAAVLVVYGVILGVLQLFRGVL